MEMVCLMSVLIVTMATHVQSQNHHGTCNGTSGVLCFSDMDADADFVHKSQPVGIYCYAYNFIGNVTWYREDSFGRRTLFSPTSNNYHFLDRAQLLMIHEASMRDNGTYICTATNNSLTVNFRFTLHVYDCERSIGNVVPVEIPPPVKYAAVGDTVTLECLGFFGCGTLTPPVLWFLKYHNRRFISRLEGSTSLYSVTPISKRNDTIRGSRLTFKMVTEENFTRTYICDMLPVDPNQLSFPVELKRKLATEILPYWLQVLLISVASVIVVSLLLLLLTYLWGSQMIFYVKTKLNCGWQKSQGDVSFDVCLISSSESTAFVCDNIYDVLLSYGYRVFWPFEENGEGKLDAYVQMDGLNRSSHVLLFLSSEEEVENIRQFFMQSCVQIQGGSRIIIIHKGPLKESLRNLKPQIQAKLKIVKSIEWPHTTEATSRNMKNFWCSVRLSLPVSGTARGDTATRDRVHIVKNERNTSTSSHQPLLEEEDQGGKAQ